MRNTLLGYDTRPAWGVRKICRRAERAARFNTLCPTSLVDATAVDESTFPGTTPQRDDVIAITFAWASSTAQTMLTFKVMQPTTNTNQMMTTNASRPPPFSSSFSLFFPSPRLPLLVLSLLHHSAAIVCQLFSFPPFFCAASSMSTSQASHSSTEFSTEDVVLCRCAQDDHADGT